MKTPKMKKPGKKNLKGSLDYRGMISNDPEFMKNQDVIDKIQIEIESFTVAVRKIVEDYGRKVMVITSLEFKE